MKRLWLFVFLALIALPIEGMMPRGNGLNCPTANPSPDGSIIFPVGAGLFSCPLKDTNGPQDTWQYQGTTVFRTDVNGTNNMGQPSQLQINSGGIAFRPDSCVGRTLWRYWSFQAFQWAPGVPGNLGSLQFTNLTSGLSFNNLDGLMVSATTHDGDQVRINALHQVAGVPFIWGGAGRINHKNITFTITANSGIGCDSALSGNAILALDNNTGATGTTITGAGPTSSTIGYVHDTQSGNTRCVNLGNDPNWTVSHVMIRDCDLGVQATSTPSGIAHMTDIILEHHGGEGPVATSTTHNVYLGWIDGLTTDLSQIIVDNVRSYCTNGKTAGPGFQFKTRWPAGTLTNVVFAEPSQLGYTDCAESAAVDFSCGGNYTVGGTTAGTGVVIELGPHAVGGNGDGVIRWDRESGNTVDCPQPNGWPAQTLLVQNCWIINDDLTHTGITAIHANTFGGSSVTVKNCKLVNVTGLGAGVTDGGGNTFFANRVDAGLPAYPALPSVP